MNDQLSALAIGLFVRIGVPGLLLAGLVWLMRRLDARWQAEAMRQPAARPVAGPACWEAHNCASERRAACPAFANPQTPCWQQFRDRDGNLRSGCLACEFFASVPIAKPLRAEAHASAAQTGRISLDRKD
ncbi:MAG: hypothetical protein ABI847_06100 [Anaerolineales bacterium]